MNEISYKTKIQPTGSVKTTLKEIKQINYEFTIQRQKGCDNISRY